MIKTFVEKILGHRYYAVAIVTNGTSRVQLASAIHRSRAEAEAHAAEIDAGRTFSVIAVVTFRSRREL